MIDYSSQWAWSGSWPFLNFAPLISFESIKLGTYYIAWRKTLASLLDFGVSLAKLFSRSINYVHTNLLTVYRKLTLAWDVRYLECVMSKQGVAECWTRLGAIPASFFLALYPLCNSQNPPTGLIILLCSSSASNITS